MTLFCACFPCRCLWVFLFVAIAKHKCDPCSNVLALLKYITFLCVLYGITHNSHDCSTLQNNLNSFWMAWKVAYVNATKKERSSLVWKFKQLGVHFPPDFSWSHHINHVTNEAGCLLVFQCRNGKKLPDNAATQLYIPNVRSLRLHLCCVWFEKTCDMCNLERIRNMVVWCFGSDFSRMKEISVNLMARFVW